MVFLSNDEKATETFGTNRRLLHVIKTGIKDVFTSATANVEVKILILGWQGSGKSLFLHIGGGIKKKPCEATETRRLPDGICFIKDPGFTLNGFKATSAFDIGGEFLQQKNALVYDTLKDIDAVLYFFNAKQLSDKEYMLGFSPDVYTLGAIRQFILHFVNEFPSIDPNASKDDQKDQKERQKHKSLKKIIFVGTHTDQLSDDDQKNELKTLLGYDQLKSEIQTKIPGIGVYFVCGSQCDDNNPANLKKEVWYNVISCFEEE
ncbi:MAG: hypothetical protein MJ033_07925 [Victivallaceae bacterium]|nr:hypothetical protein [Victivallaceae bacterium]